MKLIFLKKFEAVLDVLFWTKYQVKGSHVPFGERVDYIGGAYASRRQMAFFRITNICRQSTTTAMNGVVQATVVQSRLSRVSGRSGPLRVKWWRHSSEHDFAFPDDEYIVDRIIIDAAVSSSVCTHLTAFLFYTRCLAVVPFSCWDEITVLRHFLWIHGILWNVQAWRTFFFFFFFFFVFWWGFSWTNWN